MSTQGVGTHPLLLTPTGGHQNMYGWQAGGTHPTGVLSCFKLKLQIHLLLYCQLHFNSFRMRLSPYKSCVYQTNLLKIPKNICKLNRFIDLSTKITPLLEQIQVEKIFFPLYVGH